MAGARYPLRMPLAANAWYEVTFKHSTDPAWSALVELTDIPRVVMRALTSNATMVIFVWGGVQTEVSFLFGGYQGYATLDQSLFATSTQLTSQTFTAQDGSTLLQCALDSAGNLWTTKPNNGGLTSFGDGERASLAAFLA